MSLELKSNFKFSAESLLCNISYGTLYEVKEKWAKHRMVVDDKAKKVWLSGNVIRKYFKEA